MPQPRQRLPVETQVFQGLEPLLPDVGDPQHGLFTDRRREDRDPEIHVDSRDRDRDATVLRKAPLRDVELAHHLDPRDHRCPQRTGDNRHVSHHPIHAGANVKVVLPRDEVDVRSAELDRGTQQPVHLFDGGRALGVRLEIDRRLLLLDLFRLVLGLIEMGRPEIARIHLVETCTDRCWVGDDEIECAVQCHPKLVDDDDVGWVGDRDTNTITRRGQRQHAQPACSSLGHQGREVRAEGLHVDHHVPEAELIGESNRDVLLVERLRVHEMRSQSIPARLCGHDRLIELIPAQAALPDQDLSQTLANAVPEGCDVHRTVFRQTARVA